VNAVERIIEIGPFASYAFQGGSATSCGLTTLAGNVDIAAVMLAASSFSQTGAGYLTFFSDTTPDPSTTVVSMFYTAGPVQTAFVVAPTDLIPTVYSAGISRGANTQVTLDIVGYFAKPHAAALDCVTVLGPQTPIAASTSTNANAGTCAAGYTQTAIYCNTNSYGTTLAGYAGTNINNACYFNNGLSPASIRADITCCRTPGR
jgi:hypothetical protein